MAITTSEVTVAATATLIATGGALVMRIPSGGSDVYIGGSDVTTANAPRITAADGPVSFDLKPNEALYGIVASSTQALRVLRSA